jgi:hypothetical protein
MATIIGLVMASAQPNANAGAPPRSATAVMAQWVDDDLLSHHYANCHAHKDAP